MKNKPPCHGCKYEHQDKNKHVCAFCDARYRYAHGQHAETPIFDTKNDSEGERKVKTKTCEVCGKEKMANSTDFQPASRSKDGLTRACRECRAKAEKPAPEPKPVQADKKSEPVQEPEWQVPPEKRCSRCGEHYPATPEYFCKSRRNIDGLSARCKSCESQRKRAEKGKLILDMTEIPGMMDGLEAMAKTQMRTVEAQAMWILKEAVS